MPKKEKEVEKEGKTSGKAEEEVEKEGKKSEKVEGKEKDEKISTELEAKIRMTPFPSRLRSTKKEREDDEIMDVFRKVELNIPLLSVIQQIPRYAKLLKDFCTSKRKLKSNEMVQVSENVSAVLQKRMPPKCKDPRVFTVPCKLGNLNVSGAMLDLGASINVLPYSLYKLIGMGTLNSTGVMIKLADRSIVRPKGVLEDVLVQVNELVFPADFYVLDMGDDDNPNPNSILLGRPFLKTARTKIDVHNGTLSMEFDGEVIHFNISEAPKPCSDMHDVNFVDVIQPLTNNSHDITNNVVQALGLTRGLNEGAREATTMQFGSKENLAKVGEKPPLEKKQKVLNGSTSRKKLKKKLMEVLPQPSLGKETMEPNGGKRSNKLKEIVWKLNGHKMKPLWRWMKCDDPCGGNG